MKTKTNLCLALLLTLPILATSGLTGCDQQNAGPRTAGETVDDKALTSRVKSALADNSEYKFDDVAVNSYRGTVQLSGFVNTTDQKQKAGDIAANVVGSKSSVENNISVKDKVVK